LNAILLVAPFIIIYCEKKSRRVCHLPEFILF